jgi:hypothetical protein
MVAVFEDEVDERVPPKVTFTLRDPVPLRPASV